MKYTYRMSHAGSCPKVLSAERIGLEIPPPLPILLIAANEGHLHEKAVKELLKSEGHIVTGEQNALKLEYEGFDVTGHIDGVIELNDKGQYPDRKLLEIKSMSQGEFNRWVKGAFNEFPSYAVQLSLYMSIGHFREAYYVVKNRNTGFIDRRIIPAPLMDIAPIIDKFFKIENHARDNQLYPAEYNPDNLDCRRCRIKHLCLPKVDAKDTDVVLNETELNAAVSDFRLGQKCLDEGDKLVNSAKAAFKKYLNNNRLNYGPITAANIPVKKTSYDNKILENLVDKEIIKPALKVTEYNMFRVWDNERYE